MSRIVGYAAMLAFATAITVFGMAPSMLDQGFSHRTHPLAWLGASGVSQAAWFNLCGFVLPGTLAGSALWLLRSRLPGDARLSARIGAQLVMLSAFAFAAQGLLPLDLEDPDGVASGLHALAWTAWCLAFCSGALMLAWGLRSARPHPRIVAMCALAGIAVPLLAFAVPLWLPSALAQRAAFLLWFGWVAWLGRMMPSLSRA